MNQFFTRGEAVVSLFDDRFKNYFGVNYTDHWNWNKGADTAFAMAVPTVNRGDRDQVRLARRRVGHSGTNRGHGSGSRIPNACETETVTAENGNRAGYVELQSDFAQRFFLVANARQDENDRFKRTHDLPCGAGRSRSGDGNEAQGELRDRVQGAHPQSALRELSGVQFLRQSEPASRKKASAMTSASSSRSPMTGFALE